MNNKSQAFLLTCDDNYMKGLIAALNSIIKKFPKAKIYLIHSLSKENLRKIIPYVYKKELFNSKIWKHLLKKDRHITRTGFGRFQVDFIEEENFFYMDVDTIVNKKFNWENPKTMSLDIKIQPINSKIKAVEKLEIMREYIIKRGGLTESSGDFKLFTDNAFFCNKEWMIKVLRPKILEVSLDYIKNKIPQRFFDMQYFHTALCLLKHPVREWNISVAWIGLPYNKEEYPKFFKYKNYTDCELIHYVGMDKPWLYYIDKYPYEGSELWWDCYLNGPIPPI